MLGSGLVLFLILWLVCGFCSGCLSGLLFRNGLAAGVFALGWAILLAGVWIPSLLDGGLNYWQPLGPPLLLLASTPLLLRPWAAGRIVSWTTVSRLAPFAVLAVLWTAFGLCYRVLEVPDVAAKYDVAVFRAAMPKPDDNPAGERVRAACVRFANLRTKLDAEQPDFPAIAGPAARPQRAMSPRFERLVAALHQGWPAADADLDDYLSRLGDDEWRTKLAEAADLPTGMAEDPRRLTVADLTRLPEPQSAPSMAFVLAVSGLRRQAHGNDAAFVEDLRVGLSLSRNLRHYGPPRNAAIGKSVEGILLIGADRWLERLDGRPDLLKQALTLLSDHLKEAEAEDGDRVLVDYLIARNTLEYPLDWLTEDLDNENRPGPGDSRARDEALTEVQARLVPWEHARQERLLRVLFEGDRDQQRGLYDFWRPTEMLGSIRLLAPGYYSDRRNGFERCRARQCSWSWRCGGIRRRTADRRRNWTIWFRNICRRSRTTPIRRASRSTIGCRRARRSSGRRMCREGRRNRRPCRGDRRLRRLRSMCRRGRASCGASAPTGPTTAACSRPTRRGAIPSRART